jgi:hypothetical protein
MTEDKVFITNAIQFEVLLAAFQSDDDVGVFLRAHHIVEQAAESAARAVYENYDALGFGALASHLKALRARGCHGPVIEAATVVSKARKDFAHTRSFAVTEQNVVVMETILRRGGQRNMALFKVPIDNKVTAYPDLKPAHRHLVMCVIIAASIEQLGQNYKKALEKRDFVRASSGSE